MEGSWKECNTYLFITVGGKDLSSTFDNVSRIDIVIDKFVV